MRDYLDVLVTLYEENQAARQNGQVVVEFPMAPGDTKADFLLYIHSGMAASK